MGSFRLEKRWLRDDLITTFQYPKRAYKMERCFFARACKNRKGGMDLKLKTVDLD